MVGCEDEMQHRMAVQVFSGGEAAQIQFKPESTMLIKSYFYRMFSQATWYVMSFDEQIEGPVRAYLIDMSE